MYYKVSWTNHGSDYPFHAYGNDIKIRWGIANKDGSDEKERGKKDTSSQKPPKDTGTVKYNVDRTGAATFQEVANEYAKDNGLQTLGTAFVENLMRIRFKIGGYKTKDRVRTEMVANHDSHIGDDTVEKQLNALDAIVDDNLDLIIK
jgi:hypothetical protein